MNVLTGYADWTMVIILFCLAIALLAFSIFLIVNERAGVSVISIGLMVLSGAFFLLIASMLVDGSIIELVTTNGTTEAVPIQNISVSKAFQYTGLLLIGLSIVQAIFIKNPKVFHKDEFGEWDNEEEF